MIDLGCPPEKVAVQRIAIPVHEMARRGPRRGAADKTIIVFAGRFCEQKGVLYALEAVREVWAERRDIEFRLIGDETLTDGRYAARIYDYVRAYSLQQCVRFLGFLDYADYLKEMLHGDIFLAPSLVSERGESEGGAPTTILEAQALGIPVISTRHCDIPNVTRPGESALLATEKDSACLARALRSLLDDSGRRQRMGEAGRLHVERYHDIEREAPVLEERYLEVMERARTAQVG
jgi:colanic acid/amylovoran biosynthesis glycosyltransferase